MDGPSLPRSIRWRLQLGVWRLPERVATPTATCSATAAAATIAHPVDPGSSVPQEDLQQQQQQQQQQQNHQWTMEEILDYNRDIVQNQRGTYDLLGQMLQETVQEEAEQEQEQERKAANAAASNGASSNLLEEGYVDVDPLTAIVQERDAHEQRLTDLDLQFRKRRARRKRGGGGESSADSSDRSDTYSSSLTLGIIEKDLNRLPRDHHTYHHSRKNFSHQGDAEEIPFDTSVKERSAVLTELLQIHAQQNPHIGYRQGMHEVSSYLLLAIEMDIFDLESNHREMNELMDPQYLAHDAYFMFDSVMNQLGPSYDVKMNQGSESPMEQMALSILSKIRDTAGDKNLYNHLMSLNCPPELYCTRWVRLMFSREVAGYNNVLLLWDIFFDLISTACSHSAPPLTSMSLNRYTRPGVTPALQLGDFNLMVVLEATSASMVLLQRNSLLINTSDDGGHVGNDSDSIHRLMNVPPLKNILPLTATLLSMMRRIQLQHDRIQQQPSPLGRKKSITGAFSDIAKTVGTIWANTSVAVAGGASSPPTPSRSISGKRTTSSSNLPRAPTFEEQQEERRQEERLEEARREEIRLEEIRHREEKRAAERREEERREMAFLTQRPAPRRGGTAAVDALPGALAATLHESLFCVKNYLLALEGAPSHVIPQAVWKALEDAEHVRVALVTQQATPPASPVKTTVPVSADDESVSLVANETTEAAAAAAEPLTMTK